jgi:hypothetical protein
MKNFGAVYTEGKILPRVSPFFASSLTIFSDIFITMVSFLTHKWGSSPVAGEILSLDDKILLASIRDWRGDSLAVKSRESFEERFRVNRLAGSRFSGSLAVAALAVVNEVVDVFGEVRGIITLHEDCKLMLLPMPSHEVLIGLVLERSPDTEEEEEGGYHIANKIERLMADTS